MWTAGIQHPAAAPGVTMTTVAVDWTRCDGHGLCARILHEKISLDEWGFPIIDHPEVAPHLVRAARQVAMVCPVLALRVE